VLLLHRTMSHAEVVAGIKAALTVGAVSPDVVAVEARCHASEQAAEHSGGSSSGRHLDGLRGVNVHRVVSLTQYRLADPAAVIAELPPDRRPLPTVDAYDDLLTIYRPSQKQETGT
jgi:hypothetical protein